jgi:hypothetical protein
MRTIAEVENQFAYHPATKETAVVHDGLRCRFTAMAGDLWSLLPDGPEKTIVMRKLQEALMYANLAVALTAPEDQDTPAVARVVPPDPPSVLYPSAGVGG